MTGFSTLWQRTPGLFVLCLSTLTIGGLVIMLSDAASWKTAGFLLAAFPSCLGTYAYRTHRRRGSLSSARTTSPDRDRDGWEG
jgi:hypothetical protein